METLNQTYRQNVIEQIENLLLEVMKDISNLKEPVLFHPNNKSWENVVFDDKEVLSMQAKPQLIKISSFSNKSFEKIGLIFKLLSIIYNLVQRNIYSTKRDIYYQAPEIFSSQNRVDNLINEIVLLLKVPRWQLHIVATSKGLIAGDIQYFENGKFIDCKNISYVPIHLENIRGLQSKAEYMLVIEKDATFQKLVDNNFAVKNMCIILTAKGFPDINTRAFLKLISDCFQFPIYCLVDGDPHGIEIMATYKFGSLAMSSYSNYLAVPNLKWLGILPTDVKRLKIPESTLISLTALDIKKAKELLLRKYIVEKNVWKNEIEELLMKGKKSEIQCLDKISPTYLTDVYLPNKIRFDGWI